MTQSQIYAFLSLKLSFAATVQIKSTIQRSSTSNQIPRALRHPRGLQSPSPIPRHKVRNNFYVPLSSNSLGGAPLVKNCLKDTRQCLERRQRQQTPAECLKPQGKSALGPNADTLERCDLAGESEERGACTAGPQARGCGKVSLLAQLSRFPVPPTPAPCQAVPGTAPWRGILMNPHAGS